MGNVAVRLYEDVPAEENPLNIPGNWPAQTEDLGESSETPDDGNTWVVMTQEEFDLYVEENRAEYEAWKEADAITEKPSEVIQSLNESEELARAVFASAVANRPQVRVRFETNEIAVNLLSGAFYLALVKMADAPTDEFLTSEILVESGNKLRVYLGLSEVGDQGALKNDF